MPKVMEDEVDEEGVEEEQSVEVQLYSITSSVVLLELFSFFGHHFCCCLSHYYLLSLYLLYYYTL